MAVYKVPQDVEAEDKLLGPFSFRQFVYLIIAGIGGIIAWILWGLSPFLAVIPLPVIGFFVILALPLRKDQPMEIYLIAVVQFFLKPKKRLWSPDGTMSLVQITAPKVLERHLSKSISENEAIDRLSYLAEIMDTRGWASRGVKDMGTAVSSTVAEEASQAEDVLDRETNVAKSFDTLIEQKDAARRDEAIATMRKQASAPRAASPEPEPQAKTQTVPTIPDNPYSRFLSQAPVDEPDSAALPASDDSSSLHYDPYPTSMHQQIVQPVGKMNHSQPQSTPPPAAPQNDDDKKPGAGVVSPGIMNLANNPDLSISTIAHEARRLQDKSGDNTEVVIPLR